GDVVDENLDSVLLPPFPRELVEPLVVGRDEVAPRDHPERRPPVLGGRLTGVQHRCDRCSPQRGPGDPDEVASRQLSHRLTSLGRVLMKLVPAETGVSRPLCGEYRYLGDTTPWRSSVGGRVWRPARAC